MLQEKKTIELWKSEFREYLNNFMSQSISEIEGYLNSSIRGDKKSSSPMSQEYARERAARIALDLKRGKKNLEHSLYSPRLLDISPLS